MTQFDKLSELLLTALSKAPAEDLGRLAEALERYSETYGQTWKRMTQDPRTALAKLLDSMVEASDARPGSSSF